MHEELGEPVAGIVFSGTAEALSRLEDAAAIDGLRLMAQDIGGGAALRLGSEHSFEDAMSLVRRVQAGEFGTITLGFLAG